MRRSVTFSAAVFCALLSGCSYTFRNPVSDTQNFMLVTSKGGKNCYTRIIDGIPFDQVCQKKDFLRYTDTPEVHKFAAEVPNHVMVLFEAHGKRPPVKLRHKSL